MANCYYQFSFTDSTTSDLTIQFSNDGTNWSNYQEPGFPPTPSNRGNVLQVNYQDNVFIWLKGPAGWGLNGEVQVIVARANSAASGQNYSPFVNSTVWMHSAGGWLDSNNLVWQVALGQVTLNPGRGKSQKYEITIAFNAQLPTAGQTYFSEDPEMDVQGM
jgi:hypothetical protein